MLGMVLEHDELAGELIGAAIAVHKVGLHRLNLIVEKRIVVELKAVKGVENVHFAIVRSYLTVVGLGPRPDPELAKLTLEIERVGRLTRHVIVTERSSLSQGTTYEC